MSIVLRVMGAVWILLTVQKVFKIISVFFAQGFHFNLGLTDILTLTMLAGGIGLLLLKEWGRWILLLGSVGFLVLLIGPSLMRFQLGPVVLKQLVFYGIFITLLLIPQARAVTHK